MSSRQPAGIAAAALIAALALGACGDDGDAGGGTAAAQECESVSAPEPKQVELKAPKLLEPDPRRSTLLVETSCGDFEIELDVEGAPKTAASIQHLVDNGVYDGTNFHRIAPGRIVQGGDPQLDGFGGPGYTIVETPSLDLVYERGLVAMAKTEVEPRGTSGSQFFIVTAPADAGFPPDFAPAGRVSNGFEVVERIDALGDPETLEPSQPVVIERVSFAAAG